MSDDSDNKKNIDINVSYTIDTPVKTGKIVSAKKVSIVGEKTDNSITLDDLRTIYEQSGNSGEVAYQYLVDYLKENKNNVEAINTTVGSILNELGIKYDKTNVKHTKVGKNQADFLSTVFSSGKWDETSGLICGPIHNFVRDALQDAGIEAVSVAGSTFKDTSDDSNFIDKFTNHTTLLYKNSNGTYTFSNYGSFAIIEADNIKDAIYTAHKETGLLEGAGQITIQDKDGSYQEFALSESSAYGNIIDKRDYNNESPAANPVASNSALNINADVSSAGNIAVSGDITLAKTTDKGAKSTTFGAEYRKSGETSELYNSESIGVMADYAKTSQVSDNTDLAYNVRGVYSHTTGELTADYDFLGIERNNAAKSVEDCSYETLMLRGSVSADTKLFDNGKMQLSNLSGASIQGYGVIGHSKHYSSSYDARVTVEDGIRLSTENFTGNVTGGVVIDTQQDCDGMKPVAGAKLNAGIDYTFKPNDNLSVYAKTKGYGVFTKTSTDTGLQANVGVNWANPDDNGKIENIWGSAGFGLENQTLQVGGFSQTTEKKNSFITSFGMNINKKTNLSLNYTQSNNTLNSTKSRKQLWATLGLNF